MTTPRELTPLAFIQHVRGQPKFKRNLTLHEIAQMMKNWKSLGRMHDKGLFIVVMSQLINYQFQLFTVRMRTFYNEVNPIAKPIRKKRDAQQTRNIRRKKRTDDKDKNLGAEINLQEEANKILSNTSSQLQQQKERQKQMQQPKAESEGTNSQNIPKVEEIPVDFQGQLDRLGQFEGNENPPEGLIPEDNTNTVSNASSSSASIPNMIPNLQEKLKILGGDVSFEGKRTVARRRAGLEGATVRRRPQKVDTEIQLQKTQILDITQVPQRIVQEKRRVFDLKKQSQEFQTELHNLTVGIKDKLFSTQNLGRLKNFHRSQRQGGQIIQPEEPFIDFSMNQEQTSYTLPQSTFTAYANEQSEFNKLTMQHFDSNIFRDEHTTTVKKLANRTHRPKEQIFLKALWMAQRGQIDMSQQNPQSFGEISISLLLP